MRARSGPADQQRQRDTADDFVHETLLIGASSPREAPSPIWLAGPLAREISATMFLFRSRPCARLSPWLAPLQRDARRPPQRPPPPPQPRPPPPPAGPT